MNRDLYKQGYDFQKYGKPYSPRYSNLFSDFWEGVNQAASEQQDEIDAAERAKEAAILRDKRRKREEEASERLEINRRYARRQRQDIERQRAREQDEIAAQKRLYAVVFALTFVIVLGLLVLFL